MVQIDINVVIRSVGERTVNILKESVLRQQITDADIKIIQVFPFESALREMMNLSLASQKKWTIALDGDTVIFDNAISKLVDAINKLPRSAFTLQGNLYDKIFGEFRPVGHRIYRTEYFQKALQLIPNSGEFMRPETTMIERMTSLGYGHFVHNKVHGLHGYEQYYRDIYRTSFTHGIKHATKGAKILHSSLKKINFDSDYSIVIRGLVDGMITTKGVNLDASTYSEISYKLLAQLGLKEKDAVEELFIEKVLDNLEFQYRKILKENPIFQSNRFGYVAGNIYKYGVVDGLLRNFLDWRRM